MYPLFSPNVIFMANKYPEEIKNKGTPTLDKVFIIRVKLGFIPINGAVCIHTTARIQKNFNELIE